MGRRPDTPALQNAKGNPGRRISKKQREAQERQAAAAALAATPVAAGTTLEPPAELREPHFARALAKWQELGPELERTNRLQATHRQMFAMLCIYLAEWWEACEDLAKNGSGQTVKTVAGDNMERARPAAKNRAEAYAAARDLAQQFGLTPREEYALFKDQATVARENPGLFGSSPTPAANDQTPAPTTTIGAMGRLKSEPPSRQVN